jgi:hypothetical protein
LLLTVHYMTPVGRRGRIVLPLFGGAIKQGSARVRAPLPTRFCRLMPRARA